MFNEVLDTLATQEQRYAQRFKPNKQDTDDQYVTQVMSKNL